AMVLPGAMGLGIESMAWGALVGAIIGNLVIPAWMMLREGSSFRPSLDLKTEGVSQFFILLLPILLGFSLPSMVNFITQKFASSYNQTGLNIVLSSANNLMQAPLGIFGQALALAAFPVLAEFAATNQMPKYRDQVSKTLRTVIYVGVPSGALMFAFAPQIVNVLYGYGQAAKSEKELNDIVECLRIYSFAIFAWCVQPILMRGFFSIQKTFKPIAISTLMTALFIGLCVWATKTSPDYRWIPWATNVAAILLGVALFWALEREVGKLDRAGTLTTLFKSTVAGVAAAAFGFFATVLWNPLSKLGNVASLGLLSLTAMWIYFYITKWLDMPETAYFERALTRLNRKSQPESEGEEK
ncbi:MAG: lipid II flippase MurJ, partial [Fimbriimonadaceae bacterium]